MAQLVFRVPPIELSRYRSYFITFQMLTIIAKENKYW